MYELYPYFTNDGTVGLYSCSDDDIYHSAFGALSESWQKFIIPSHLEHYMKTHDKVKILDICYGIGYNTKAALNVFINNYMEKQKYFKKSGKHTSSIEAIYVDNVLSSSKNEFLPQNQNKLSKMKPYKNICNYKIYADNIVSDSAEHAADINIKKISKNDNQNVLDLQKWCNNILIDAVDTDKVLIGLSPYIARSKKRKLFLEKNRFENSLSSECSDNLLQAKKISESKLKKLPKKFKLRKEVSIIILEKLFEQNGELLKDGNLKNLLTEKRFNKYFDPYMRNLSDFYSNSGYKSEQMQNKPAFLHNIYYQYISRSYKNAQKVLKNNLIDLNFYHSDARMYIKESYHKYNFIFLDAFTPAKCPSLWSIEFFKELHYKLEDDGMILTYSCSAAIRNAFLQNGFSVGKIFDESLSKYVGTIATKNKSLIEHCLDDKDRALINSKAGICYQDENLDLDNDSIIKNREQKFACSNLISSKKVLKEYRND